MKNQVLSSFMLILILLAQGTLEKTPENGVPSIWSSNEKIVTGNFIISQTNNIQTTSVKTKQLTVSYLKALTSAPQNIAFALLDCVIEANNDKKLSLKIVGSVGQNSLTSFSVVASYYILTSVKVNYLVVDPNFPSSIFTYVLKSQEAYKRSGPFVESKRISYQDISDSPSLNENVNILAFLNGFSFSSTSKKYTLILNTKAGSTDFEFTFSQSQKNTIVESYPTVSFILFNKAADGRFSFKFGSIKGVDSQVSVLQVTFKSPYNGNKAFFGLNSFFYQKFRIKFHTTSGQITKVSIENGAPFKYLNFAYFGSVFRSCPSSAIYFDKETATCYGICPVRKYADSTAQACLPCHYTCLTCSDSTITKCVSCNQAQNRELVDSKCQPKDGYYENGVRDTLKCSDAIGNCFTCQSAQDCRSCSSGFFLESPQKCTQCNINIVQCLTCTSSRVCASCKTGYFVNSQNSCTVCSEVMEHCLTCSSGTNCNSCAEKFFINSENSCTSCSIINKCITCVIESECSTCEQGYFLNDQKTCTKCQEALDNCLVCSSGTNCNLCQEKFFINNQNTCSSCSIIDNCLTCSSGTNCNSCAEKFFINSENSCTSCSIINKCITCVIESECSTCEQGYFLNDQKTCAKCSSVISDCDSCSSSTNCLTCASYYFLQTPDLCRKCSSVIQNCNQCQIAQGSLHCTQCFANYEYFESLNACISCEKFRNCKECTSTSCTECSTGFLPEGGACKSCNYYINGCQQCSRTDGVVSCQVQGINYNINNYIAQTINSQNEKIAIQKFVKNLQGTLRSLAQQQMKIQAQQVFRSLQCLRLAIPDQRLFPLLQYIFSQVLDNEKTYQYYFATLQGYSGQAIRLTSTQALAGNCGSLSDTVPPQYLGCEGTSPVGPLQTLVVLHPLIIGYLDAFYIPSILQSLYPKYPELKFNAGIVSISPWFNDRNYLNKIVQQYLSQQSLLETPVQQPLTIYQSLEYLTNAKVHNYQIPSTISRVQFDKFSKYFYEEVYKTFNFHPSAFSLNNFQVFIKQNILQGKKVVILTYGQGVTYTNKLYALLSSVEKSYVRTVSIAPYSNTLPQSAGAYFSNPQDTVLTNLRQFASSSEYAVPLNPNQVSKVFSPETVGYNHEFSGYLINYGPQIAQKIILAKNQAAQPTSKVGNGPLTVTLTWDHQPIQDLLVFEPSGVKVYYGNNQGQVGRYDYDSYNGYGPQHYYTDCQKIKAGTFILKVYGNSLAAPSNGTIAVTAGSTFYIRNYVLKQGQTLQLARVSVVLNPAGTGFIYTIVPS